MSSLRTYALILGFLPSILLAAAQPSDRQTQQLKSLTLEQLGDVEVTTQSKEPTEVWKTPAAIYVLTSEDIRRSGVTSVPDALRLVPGVNVFRVNGSRNWAVGIRSVESTRSWFGATDFVRDRKMQRNSPTGQLPPGRPRRTQFVCSLLVSLLLSQCSILLAPAQPPKPTEYDVKAAYLLNFGKFVRLSGPSLPHTSFDICVVGHDPMGPSLDALAANSTVDNLPVHIDHPEDVTGAKSCSIVFLSSTESDRIHEDLAILRDADILTVSDDPDFLRQGGMIQFVRVSNHVRFAVNLDAVNRTHLILSSELLRVAASISGKPPTGELP